MIHSYAYCLDHVGEIGQVVEVKDFLVRVSDLSGAFDGEGVSFESGEHGRVLAFDKDYVDVLVLSRSPVFIGTNVARTGQPISISTGGGILGRTLDTFGNSPTKRRFASTDPQTRPIEIKPVGINGREKITHFFETGIGLIDLLIPLGAGQRELIIGDRKTGKTHLLLQILLSQVREKNIVIYCAIGKRKTEIKNVEEFLRKNGCLQRSLIVAADSYASPGEIYLAPYTAMTIAEYFRDQDRNVLLILDDMTTHAKYCREIALLAGRFPGRESYPSDIFHLHSKVLERSGCFNINGKVSTITCLPIAESIGSDITGYIQTNLMSMTDGHIYIDNDIFAQGRRPAINIFLSVTRVGRQTQSSLSRDVGNTIYLLLKKHENAQRFLRFGPELSPEIQAVLKLGNQLYRFFNQTGVTPIPFPLQLVMVSLIWQDLWQPDNYSEAVKKYFANPSFKSLVDTQVDNATSFDMLNEGVLKNKTKLLKYLNNFKCE